MAESEDTVPSVLLPCNSCGRTFRPDALSKHTKYCEKSLIKKRKVFDSAKQRIQGTDLAEFLPVITQKKKYDKSPIRKTQSKWKEKHMELVRAIRAARVCPSDGSTPATSVKPVDHEKCLYCERYFGPKAYDRHLDWCKEHSTRIQPKNPASIQAKERLEARTKYKAPLLNKTRRASVSEKCSPKNCTRDPSPADRLTRARSSSLSSRSVPSSTRETSSNDLTKNMRSNTVLDPFRRNQPARNSRRSISPMKKKTPDTARNKTVNINTNQNNRNQGRQATSHLKSETKKESIGPSKTMKDDIFKASCNISAITPGENRKQNLRTPTNNSMDTYDPYKSAERQMKELLGLSDEDDALVQSLVPQPPVLNSLNSAFVKFSSIPTQRDPDNSSNRSSDFDLDSDFERLEAEAESRTTPTSSDRCGIVDKNFNPMSLSTISLCSTISIESFDNNKNNLRKGISSSAKVQSCDRKAQLPLQRSVSVVETPHRRGRDFLRNNLKMEHLLFGVSGNAYNFNDNPLDCDFNDGSSDNKDLKSSNEKLKTSNSSLVDVSQAEQELLKSVSEFEKLFVSSSSLNPYPALIPSSSPASTLTPLDHIDNHRSQASRFITDSAYNSLNRKSPQQESSLDNENCSSGSECSLSRAKTTQSANFCHECGAKFPVLAAKFCCNCGVRRLLI